MYKFVTFYYVTTKKQTNITNLCDLLSMLNTLNMIMV